MTSRGIIHATRAAEPAAVANGLGSVKTGWVRHGVAWRLVGGRLRNVRVCRKPATSSPDYAADARLLSTLARLLTFQLHFYWTTYPYSSSR